MGVILEGLIAEERFGCLLLELFFETQVSLDEICEVLVQLMVLFLELVVFIHLLVHFCLGTL
jgi:hypothetical protein